MKTVKDANKDKGTPILLPSTKRIWIACSVLGVVFWIIGLILWAQGGIDEAVLFYYNPMRIAMDPIVVLSKWLSLRSLSAERTIREGRVEREESHKNQRPSRFGALAGSE